MPSAVAVTREAGPALLHHYLHNARETRADVMLSFQSSRALDELSAECSRRAATAFDRLQHEAVDATGAVDAARAASYLSQIEGYCTFNIDSADARFRTMDNAYATVRWADQVLPGAIIGPAALTGTTPFIPDRQSIPLVRC